MNGASPIPTTSSLTRLKAGNEANILKVLAKQGPMIQSELARSTQLSKAAISYLVSSLTDQGKIVTEQVQVSGRRAKLVRLAKLSAVVIGIDIGFRHLGVAIVSQDYDIVASRRTNVQDSYGFEQRLELALNVAYDLIAEAGISREDVTGVGLGMSSPINSNTGQVEVPNMFPELNGLVLNNYVSSLTKLPTFVGNDAGLAALYEDRWGEYSELDDFAYVLVTRGIGAGLVLRKELYLGSGGVAGEIGHLQVDFAQEACRCGNVGCLETIASTEALMSKISETGTPVKSIVEVAQQIENKNLAVMRTVEDVGSALGEIIAQVINVLNLSYVMLGGDISPIIDYMLPAVENKCRRKTVPSMSHTFKVVSASNMELAVAVGAARYALDSLFEHK